MTVDLVANDLVRIDLMRGSLDSHHDLSFKSLQTALLQAVVYPIYLLSVQLNHTQWQIPRHLKVNIGTLS